MNITNRLHIRPAVSEDNPALCDLLAELFSIESDFEPDREKQSRALRMLIDKAEETTNENQDCMVLVAEQGDQVIGMCSVQVLVSTAEGRLVGLVEDVIVHPACRNKGVGKQLLQHLEAWAVKRGLARLQLLADRENHIALGFYENVGWLPTQLNALRKKLT